MTRKADEYSMIAMTRRLLVARIIAVGMLSVAAAGGHAETSFSAHLGTTLFRYEQAYLITGVSAISDIADQMEMHLQADFGITTVESGDPSAPVQPEFLIPAGLGLNFTFPAEPMTYYLGIGLSPTFHFSPSSADSLRFYIGPYAKTGLRIQVHAIMSAFLDVEQQLLFGGPNWINTTTRIAAGVHFSFPGKRETR